MPKKTDLTPALWSAVWQKRKRTSLRLCVNAYLADILEFIWVINVSISRPSCSRVYQSWSVAVYRVYPDVVDVNWERRAFAGVVAVAVTLLFAVCNSTWHLLSSGPPTATGETPVQSTDLVAYSLAIVGP